MIKNARELRNAYEVIQVLQNSGMGDHPIVGEIKRKIRSFLKLPNSGRIIRSDFDGYIKIEQLPEYMADWRKSDVVEWFEDRCYIQPRNSLYDCTGAPFTRWYKIFRRQEKWFVYHSVGFDV